MNTMPLTMWMDRLGAIVLHVGLLAALPTAAVAILIQAL